MFTTRKRRLAFCIALAALLAGGVLFYREQWWEVRVRDVVPGKIVRGAWQKPGPLRHLIERERIRTIVTLTAINTDDPKYVAQKRVVDETGVRWIIIPMRGSTATLDQLAQASDIVADPARQPVFFHCVGGHHRSNLVHAAYRILREHRTPFDAWNELCALPWTRAVQDEDDRMLIFALGDRYKQLATALR